jgi:hypothetical protein
MKHSSWYNQEKKEHHETPFTKKWFEKEKMEHHKAIQGNMIDFPAWLKEEKREHSHKR